MFHKYHKKTRFLAFLISDIYNFKLYYKLI